MTDLDHIALIDALLKHPGPVMLSGYDSELYNSLLPDWRSIEFKAYANSGKPRTEKLWLNFEPKEGETT